MLMHWKVYLFFTLKKVWKKSKSKISNKSYSSRFIDSVTLMNDSLDSLINNLTCDLCDIECKNWIKYKNCKKYEKCKNNGKQ